MAQYDRETVGNPYDSMGTRIFGPVRVPAAGTPCQAWSVLPLLMNPAAIGEVPLDQVVQFHPDAPTELRTAVYAVVKGYRLHVISMTARMTGCARDATTHYIAIKLGAVPICTQCATELRRLATGAVVPA